MSVAYRSDMNGEGTRRVDRSGLLTSLVRFLSCPPLFTSHNPLPWLIPSFLSHSPRSGREVEPNGERRRQGAEREEPKDRGAGWMTVGTTTSASLSVPLLALGSLHSFLAARNRGLSAHPHGRPFTRFLLTLLPLGLRLTPATR